MDNIQNAKSEAEEVKVAMLENENKSEELKNVNQKPEKPQCTFQRKKCKESVVNQKMEYLRANKGLIFIVLISAALIFAVVVAMLATTNGHSHSAHNSKHIVHVHNVTEMP